MHTGFVPLLSNTVSQIKVLLCLIQHKHSYYSGTLFFRMFSLLVHSLGKISLSVALLEHRTFSISYANSCSPTKRFHFKNIEQISTDRKCLANSHSTSFCLHHHPCITVCIISVQLVPPIRYVERLHVEIAHRG